jgi:hypothetical protein
MRALLLNGIFSHCAEWCLYRLDLSFILNVCDPSLSFHDLLRRFPPHPVRLLLTLCAENKIKHNFFYDAAMQ